MPRKPTPDDLAALDDLLTRALDIAGSKQAVLERLSTLPGGRGRPEAASDNEMLSRLARYVRLAKEVPGLPPMTALRWAAQADPESHPGTNPDAVARRLYKKLKARNFSER